MNWTLLGTTSQISKRSEQLKSAHPSPSLYFFYQVDLSLISNAITNRLYGAHAPQDGWKVIKEAMMLYSQKLDSWLSTINEGMSFANGDGKLFHSMLSRDQVGLALHYYSTRILLNRPCLSRPGFKEHSGIRIPRNRFGKDTALACVRSALSLLNVLPDEASKGWFYGTAPWWTVLHFLVQAAAVLLIQLAVGIVPVRIEQRIEEGGDKAVSSDAVLWGYKKTLHWLHHMARRDLACRRALHHPKILTVKAYHLHCHNSHQVFQTQTLLIVSLTFSHSQNRRQICFRVQFMEKDLMAVIHRLPPPPPPLLQRLTLAWETPQMNHILQILWKILKSHGSSQWLI